MDFKTIAIIAAQQPEAREAADRLEQRYDVVAPDRADIIVALGGDGYMLRALHRHMDLGTPIFGMNRGSVGFLMNDYADDSLLERLARAEPIRLRTLQMTAHDLHGRRHTALAINEVSLLRETRLAAKIRIRVDDIMRLDELICDGVLVATAAGSTAYNNAAGGTILPLGADLLALTPISAFRPRRWRGALLPHQAAVTFEVLESEERPVSAVADHFEVRDVVQVEVTSDPDHRPTLLFDPEHNLEERIIKEQFLP